MIQTVEWEGRIKRRGDDRIIVLPWELVLVGESIKIRQDDWGEISIHPTSPEGRKALERFGPFADWVDDEID